ncbi:MAG: OmpH family outer membrane protein [Pseudomonadota bacterium]
MSLKRFLTSLSVAVCLGVMAFQAHAQTPPSPIIAIVDVPGVIRKSEAAKTIGAQMETFRTRFDEEARGIESQLRAQEQELAAQRNALAAEVWDERRREFESRVQSGQRDVQGRLRTLDRAYQGALRKVELKLAEIIEGLATERGVNLVLVASAAVIYTPSMDLSEESLARLNAALPSVTVELTNQ